MTLVDRKSGTLGRSVDAGAYGISGLGDLWFASDHSTTIKRVDPASGSVKATIEGKGEDNCSIAGEFPDNVWLSCFGRDVRSRSATRIDPATNTVAAVATVPPSHGGPVAIIDGEPWFVDVFDGRRREPAWRAPPYGPRYRRDRQVRVDRSCRSRPGSRCLRGDLVPRRGRSSGSAGERRRPVRLTHGGSSASPAGSPGLIALAASLQVADCRSVRARHHRLPRWRHLRTLFDRSVLDADATATADPSGEETARSRRTDSIAERDRTPNPTSVPVSKVRSRSFVAKTHLRDAPPTKRGRAPRSRSAIRSSTPSIPTDRRTSAGSTSSGEPATDMWVIAAGTSISDSTPPSDSASVNRRVPSAMRSPVPWRSARRAARRGGTRPSRRTPGSDLRHVRAGAQPGDDRGGIRPVALHPKVQRAEAAQDEEAVERAGHGAHRVLEEAEALRDGGVRGDRHAQDRVRVTGEVLRRRVEDDVRAVSSGRWSAGEANVLSTTISGRRPPCSARRATVAATAAISTTLSSGFDGVSNQTSRVLSVSASQSASGPEARST